MGEVQELKQILAMLLTFSVTLGLLHSNFGTTSFKFGLHVPHVEHLS